MSPRSKLTGSLLALVGTLSVGCLSPGSERIVGPDGSPMAHVHCGSEQGVCFRLAGELCPGGYEMKPVLSGSDGNFLVRCRAAAKTAAATTGTAKTTCPAPATPPATAPLAALASTAPGAPEAWPPTAEPWPATNPWPAPKAVAATPTATGAPAASPSDVDIGY